MADTTTELEVLDQIVDTLGGQSGQYETVVPTLQQIRGLLGGGGGGSGYNPALSVGRADALTGADTTAQWATRESTGSGSATVRSVQGAAVAWNQMAQAISQANWSKAYDTASVALEFDGSEAVISAVSNVGTSASYFVFGIANRAFVSVKSGDKMLLLIDAMPSIDFPRFWFCLRSGQISKVTEVVTTLLANNWTRCGAIITATEDMPLSYFTMSLSTTGEIPSGTTGRFRNAMAFNLTKMFGAGNEPGSVAEFEAMYPAAYYPYSAPTLKPVQIAGISSVGFNQWDEEWEQGYLNITSGTPYSATNTIRSKNYCRIIPDQTYFLTCSRDDGGNQNRYYAAIFFYDESKAFVSYAYRNRQTFTVPSNAAYFKICTNTSTVVYGGTYTHDICVNISNPALNGQYKPYTTDSIEWPTQTLRAADSVADMLYSDHVDVKVGERAYQSGDESDATVRTDGTTTYYPLETPTTTPISPALPMTYRVQQGGSESIIVPEGEVSAAPLITLAEGESASELVMGALACIAAPDGPVATANHALNTYLTMGGKLYKVTSAIAVGETITAGTNVSQTTVMDELIALTA